MDMNLLVVEKFVTGVTLAILTSFWKRIKKTVVYLVNVDEILSKNPGLASSLFNAFDMSVLPFLVESDSQGIISRRYISLVEH